MLPPGVNSEITKSIIANLQIYKYAMRMHLAAPAALAWAVTYMSVQARAAGAATCILMAYLQICKFSIMDLVISELTPVAAPPLA